jgi:DNA invertase Pin-like site-specific DNA recombinase
LAEISTPSCCTDKERRLISERTKAALAAAKARGVRLGNCTGGVHLRGLSNDAVASIKDKTDEHARSIQPMIDAITGRGIKSANGIAKALNEAGIPTIRGRQWTERSVLNLMQRF